MAVFPAAANGRGSGTRGLVDPSVAGHRRGGHGWLRSVRVQLLLPIVVATAGLVGLGAVQTLTATAAADDARRAQVLATHATDTVRLVHEVEREAAETVALRQRGGKSGALLVTAQQKRTDALAVEYRESAGRARNAAVALRDALIPAETAINDIAAARKQAGAVATASAGDKIYKDIASALLAVADALPSQIEDPDLAGRARSVAAVAAIEFFNSLERDALYTAFSNKKFAPGGMAVVANLFGSREQREAEFLRAASPTDRAMYTTLMQGPDVEMSQRMRGIVLAADRNAAALDGDQEAWYIAQSNVIRRANMVSLALTERLDDAAATVAADAERRSVLIGAGSAAVAAGVLFAAVLFAVRTSRRLRRLRAAALTVARSELPNTINAVITGRPTPALDGPSATTTTLNLAVSQDEVGQVAEAFATVHHTALRLAAEQAEVRVDVARMAETLARRIRTLITRQLRLLDEFERDETDPDALARLFVLDHIAARLRRNGENLLVLAGGEPGRGATTAVPLAVVATAAASEIEDFQRVHVSVGPLAIAAPAVGDLVHLLAELLENAAVFSPPESSVHVEAQVTPDGVLLMVHDGGIGIAANRLDELNLRLVRPGALTSAAAGTMGLNVVAHLARRHDIRVRLESDGTGHGAVALVDLPHSVLAPYDSTLVEPGAVTGGVRPALPTGRGATRLPVGAGVGPAAGFGAALGLPDAPSAGPGLFVKHSGPVDPEYADTGYANAEYADAGYANAGYADAGYANAGYADQGTAAARPVAEPVATTTSGGLPRRRPGASADASRAAFPTNAESTGPLDPDEVRSRLSSFAEGVAAAGRRNSPTGS